MNNINDKLNIVLLSFDWKNIAEKSSSELILKLERDRLQPSVNNIVIIAWSSSFYFKKLNDTVSVIHLWAPIKAFRPIYDFFSIFFIPLILFIYSIRPDVFLVYDFPFVYTGWVVKKIFSSKLVLILTNLPRQLSKTRKFTGFRDMYQAIAEYVSKKVVTFAVVINQTTKNYLLTIGLKSNKIFIFSSNTIVRDRQYHSTIQHGVLRKKYNITPEKKIILSVGRLEAEKGWDRLINSFSKINIPDLILVIVGEGSHKSSLVKQVNKLGIDNSIIFTDYVSRSDIWNYYNDSDVFMLLPYSEALGLVFWEAMFMNIPVIGSPIGGILDTIGNDGERGFLWDVSMESTDLEDKIKACLNKSPEVLNMINRAHGYVKEQIADTANFNDFYNEYLKINHQ